MPTRQRNFILYKGDTFARRINLVPGPDSDLSGYSGELVVVNDDNSELFALSTGNGMMTVNNGYIELDYPDDSTAALNTSGLLRTGTLYEPANSDELPYSGTGFLARYYLRVISPEPATVTTRLLDGQFVIVG
jgi:hypothetical protein